jgi:H+-transporting ATPase
MRRVLGVSTVLGVIGVVSAFLLFWLGERVFHMDRAHVQTLIYLKLSVAGHLTIFLTRTRGPFWTIRPAKVLWIAVLGTQIIATLIAVYGLFMTPLGWKYAGFVWAYAIVWALCTDRIKLLAYRILDPSALPLLAKKQIDLGQEISKDARARRKRAGPGLAGGGAPNSVETLRASEAFLSMERIQESTAAAIHEMRA